MTRQEKIKHLGEQIPSIRKNKRNFLSYFIIPLPHKVYEMKIDRFLYSLQKCKFEIINNTLNKRILDINKNIKKYIYNDFLPEFNSAYKKEFFIEKNHFLLRKKINEFYEIQTKYDISKVKFNRLLLKEIDLWILEENIAFFVTKFEMDKDNKLTINDISVTNRIRDFRSLKIDENKKQILFDKQNANFIDWLLNLTICNNKSFLNITKKDLEDKKLYPILNSSYYAKTLSAIHIELKNDLLDEIIPIVTTELNTSEAEKVEILEESAFLLASTSEFYPIKKWEFNENYIIETIKENGIKIWKYWFGIALKDSCIFLSLNDGGETIINNCKDINYFIYILNLYLNYSVKLLEHNLIEKYFLDIEDTMKKVIQIQKLRNLYMSEEIAIKFQPNKIHKAILKGLETKTLLKEVEENIYKTYERTKDNTDIIISLFTGFFGVVTIFLSKDEIIAWFKQKPQWAIPLSISFVIILLFFIYKRKLILSRFLKFFKKITLKIERK